MPIDSPLGESPGSVPYYPGEGGGYYYPTLDTGGGQPAPSPDAQPSEPYPTTTETTTTCAEGWTGANCATPVVDPSKLTLADWYLKKFAPLLESGESEPRELTTYSPANAGGSSGALVLVLIVVLVGGGYYFLKMRKS